MSTSSDPTHPKAIADPDEDVTGHMSRRMTGPEDEVEGYTQDTAAKPREQTVDGGDVEGHSFRHVLPGGDADRAFRRSAAPDDDDVEGHGSRGKG